MPSPTSEQRLNSLSLRVVCTSQPPFSRPVERGRRLFRKVSLVRLFRKVSHTVYAHTDNMPHRHGHARHAAVPAPFGCAHTAQAYALSLSPIVARHSLPFSHAHTFLHAHVFSHGCTRIGLTRRPLMPEPPILTSTRQHELATSARGAQVLLGHLRWPTTRRQPRCLSPHRSPHPRLRNSGGWQARCHWQARGHWQAPCHWQARRAPPLALLAFSS